MNGAPATDEVHDAMHSIISAAYDRLGGGYTKFDGYSVLDGNIVMAHRLLDDFPIEIEPYVLKFVHDYFLPSTAHKALATYKRGFVLHEREIRAAQLLPLVHMTQLKNLITVVPVQTGAGPFQFDIPSPVQHDVEGLGQLAPSSVQYDMAGPGHITAGPAYSPFGGIQQQFPGPVQHDIAGPAHNSSGPGQQFPGPVQHDIAGPAHNSFGPGQRFPGPVQHDIAGPAHNSFGPVQHNIAGPSQHNIPLLVQAQQNPLSRGRTGFSKAKGQSNRRPKVTQKEYTDEECRYLAWAHESGRSTKATGDIQRDVAQYLGRTENSVLGKYRRMVNGDRNERLPELVHGEYFDSNSAQSLGLVRAGDKWVHTHSGTLAEWRNRNNVDNNST